MHNDAHNHTLRGVRWICWIDADAVVVRGERRMEECIVRGKGRPLIVAEDQHTHCPLNAGVLCIRVCEWSLRLWEEVWETKACFKVLYYEQSALVRVLKRRHGQGSLHIVHSSAQNHSHSRTRSSEGLELVTPFHSYAGGPQGAKLFPHVCVLPSVDFNSNDWTAVKDQERGGEGPGKGSENEQKQEDSQLRATTRARFIFHAAGSPTLSKLDTIGSICRQYVPAALSPALPGTDSASSTASKAGQAGSC